MTEKEAVARLVRQVQEYAQGRARDVARGAETPRLAALLLEKYGRGLADAAASIFNSQRAADPVNLALHAEMSRIDPTWQEHARERWSARPADLDLSASTKQLFVAQE